MKTINEDNAKKAGLGYVVGNVLLKGIVFFTLPIFSRLMTTAEFGVYNNYLAYEGIIAGIIGLGLYSSIKKAIFDFKKDFESYFSSILTLIFLAYIVLLVISLSTLNFVSDFTGFNWIEIVLLLSQSFGSAIIQVYAAKLNSEFKYKQYLLVSGVNSISNITISVILIFIMEDNSFARIIGTAAPYIIIGLYLTIFSLVKGKKIFDLIFWKYALSVGLPLIPHVVSQYILNQSDRIMISYFVGDSFSGTYSFAYNVCTVLFIVYTSVEASWTPWVFTKIEAGDTLSINKASKKLLVFSLCLLIGFLSLSPDVYRLMADKDYLIGIKNLIPLSFSMFVYFLYFLPVNLEYYRKKTIFVSLGTIGAATLNILLNYFFIPMYGYEAAAYTTLASYFVMFLMHSFIALRFDFKKIYDVKFIIIILIFGFFITALYLLSSFNDLFDYIFRYSFLIIVLIFMSVYFKNEYMTFLRRKK